MDFTIFNKYWWNTIKKNTVMVSNDGENELSLIESLKVHKNIVAVVYKSPHNL